MSGNILDVFHSDPFTSIALTEAVERNPFLPSGLGELNIFTPKPIRTTALAVEARNGQLVIVPTSPRGAPATERVTEKRDARLFTVPRLRVGDTVRADEIQNVREFGQESVLMQLQAEVARRVNGPTGLTSLIEYTWERMRLGAIQGILLDANNAVLYNWFNAFGIGQPAEVPFNLAANAPATLLPICNQVVRGMARAAKGAFTPATSIYGLCGDQFWDQLTNHVDVTKTYLNWAAAEDLRKGTAFNAMRYGGIDWFNYRGSDNPDPTQPNTIGVPADKVKFFPVKAPGVFDVAYAPGESVEWVNTPGKPIYVQPIYDRDRNEWVRFEVSSYPLFICTRPEVLFSGRAGA